MVKSDKPPGRVPGATQEQIKNIFDDHFTQSLKDTLQESHSARNEMKSLFLEILREPDTVSEIKNIIKNIDRDSIKAFWSKFGFTVWSAIIFILGAAATVIIENLLSKK